MKRKVAADLELSYPVLLNQIGSEIEAYGGDAHLVASLMNKSVESDGKITFVRVPFAEFDTLLNRLSAAGYTHELKG